MIRFEDIKVGDRIRATKENESVEFSVTNTSDYFVKGVHFIVYSNEEFTFELLDRPTPLSTKLADAYGEMIGLNRYQRFAKLVEDFGLDK